MKKILSTFAAVCIVAIVFCQNEKNNVVTTAVSQNFKNNMDSVSYSLGVLFAQNFKNGEKVNIDPNAMAKGFADALDGTETIKAETANQIFSSFMAESSKKKFAGALEQG